MSVFKAFGSLLKRGNGDGPPETFTTVTNMKDLDGPGMKPAFEDVTTHSSAANGNYNEWLPTLIDGGAIKGDMLWDPNDVTHVGLQTDQANQVKRNFQVVFPTTPTKTASFAAYVDDFPFKAPVKGALMRQLSLKITGPVTIS